MLGPDDNRLSDSSPSDRVRQQAAELRSRSEALLEEQREFGKRLRVLRRSLFWVRLACGLYDAGLAARRLSDRVHSWRTGTFLVATAVFGAVCAMLVPKFAVFAGGLAVGGAVFGLLLLFPNDERVLSKRGALRRERDALQTEYAKLAGVAERHAETTANIERESEAAAEELRRRQLLESTGARRRQLCARDWSKMRGTEFESFLKVVFEELGYRIETPARGERGADIIVSKRGRRVCVQIQTGEGGVSERAVQNAHYAGVDNRCDGCAVITNRRAAVGASDLGLSIGCAVIDEDSLRSLILGEVEV